MTNDKCQIKNYGFIILFIFSLLLIVCSPVFAQVCIGLTSAPGWPPDIESSMGNLSLGYIKVGTKEVGNLAWHPDFKIGPWGLGLDVNVPLGDADKPDEYESVVLRYAGYDDGRKGLGYGIIDNLTWGHGLLIQNYSTRLYQPVFLNSDQMAFNGYIDFDSYAVRGLWTKRGVYGIRVEEKIPPVLILGQTYITDSDGVTLPGTTEVQKVSGFGVDATVPLPMNFQGYAEWAQLIDHGGGFNAGISWGYDIMIASASFLAEYRLLDKGFVPGYFDADYEIDPINLASAEATGNVKNGYLAQLGVNAFGLAALNAVYENYNDSEFASFGADLYAKLVRDIEVRGYFKQPNFTNFRSLSLEEGAVLGGSIAYPINPFTKVVAHYKKVYNPDTEEVEDSQFYELRLSF
jgi:hypothetical protein